MNTTKNDLNDHNGIQNRVKLNKNMRGNEILTLAIM